MSPRSAARRMTLRGIWQQLPLLIGLVLLWMLLWGDVSVFSAVSGLIIAITVTRIFYLPPVELTGRINIFWTFIFIVRFAWDLVASSVLVAAQAFHPGRLPLNAIIQVPLRTRSDFVMSMTATTISLVPGTLVLEIDRQRAVLFLHLLAVGDRAGVERARASALAIETSIIRAIGSRADLDRVRR